MADVVELMDFWPMDDDENIGFVAADSDFQLWLISGIGVGFDDISYSVIDGPDSSGIYELIMDFEDYMNLADLYSEYLESGWAGLEEEDFDEVFAMNNEEGNEYGAEEVNAVMVSGSVDGEPAIFNYSKGTKDDFGFTPGRIATGEDMEELIAQYPLPNVPHHRNEKGFKNYKNNVWRKHMRAEEDSTPVMDPMDFGEPVNWTPMDGTPSLKRRKDAEYNVEEDEEIGYLCDVCDEPTQADYNFQDINVKWILEDGDFTGEYEMKDHLGDFNDFLCQPCAERMNYEAENRQPPWSATNRRPTRKMECGECHAKGFIAGKECTTCDGAGYWMEPSPRCTTCESDIEWTDGAECHGCEEWVCNDCMTDDYGCPKCGDTDLSFHSEGATGDQIIAWEHNGLSSPSGPPSDIFWSEGDYGEYVQIFDTTITKKGIEEKLQRAGIKPIEVFSVYDAKTKSKGIFGVYLKEGDATAFSKEFNKNDWTGLFDFEGAVSFDAQMGHSRFQQSDNPRRDISSTRRKLKQEMFSDVSGVVNTKNMAIVGIAGIIGYLLARK